MKNLILGTFFLSIITNSGANDLCNSVFNKRRFKLSIENETVVPENAIKQATKKTAKYLNQSVDRWFNSGNVRSSQKCLSCHTTLPYMMIGKLQSGLNKQTYIRELIKKRTENFRRDGFVEADNLPWYDLEKSYSTESVLNASSLVMAEKSVRRNAQLSDLAQDTYDLMWKRQKDDGSFAWLDQFGLRPHESQNSGYWGTSMAGIMGGLVESGNPAKLRKTYKWLADNFKDQSNHNKLFGVWANAEAGERSFLTQKQIDDIVENIRKNQNADGGWSSDFILGTGNKETDPYATSIVAFILKKSKIDVPNANVVKRYMVKRFDDSAAERINGRTMRGALASPSPNGTGGDFFSDMATSYGLMYLKN